MLYFGCFSGNSVFQVRVYRTGIMRKHEREKKKMIKQLAQKETEYLFSDILSLHVMYGRREDEFASGVNAAINRIVSTLGFSLSDVTVSLLDGNGQVVMERND